MAQAEITDTLGQGQPGSGAVRNDIVKAFQGKTASMLPGGVRRYWTPINRGGGPEDQTLPIYVNLGGQGDPPHQFAHIRGQIPLLLAKEVKPVEVDMTQLSQGQPVEFLPGLTITQRKVAGPSSPGSSLLFSVERTEPAGAADSGAQARGGPQLFKVEALDPSGAPMVGWRCYLSGGSMVVSGGKFQSRTEVSCYRNGPVTAPPPMKLRLLLATSTQERLCAFELTDVPVP